MSDLAHPGIPPHFLNRILRSCLPIKTYRKIPLSFTWIHVYLGRWEIGRVMTRYRDTTPPRCALRARADLVVPMPQLLLRQQDRHDERRVFSGILRVTDEDRAAQGSRFPLLPVSPGLTEDPGEVDDRD